MFMRSFVCFKTFCKSAVKFTFCLLSKYDPESQNYAANEALESNKTPFSNWPFTIQAVVCVLPSVCPGGGVSFSTLSTGRFVLNNTFAKVLKVLSMLRRQGTPMRAHLQLPDCTTRIASSGACVRVRAMSLLFVWWYGFHYYHYYCFISYVCMYC